MVDGIGGSSLARAALEAALRSQTQARQRVDSRVSEDFASAQQVLGDVAKAPSFDRALADGVSDVNAAISKVDQLPSDLVAGKVKDFHELAVAIKQSELTFRFAMEVRNKLIDAYRETMRMSV